MFLQADPHIQDPFNLQNYKRYGYCYNSPLTCTDPSGYISRRKLLKIAAKALVAYVAYTVLGPAVGNKVAFALFDAGYSTTIALVSANYAQAATAGFVIGAVNSGSLEGGIQGAFTGMAFNFCR